MDDPPKSHMKNGNSYSDAARSAIEVSNLFDIRPMRALMLAIAQQMTPREAEWAFMICVSPMSGGSSAPAFGSIPWQSRKLLQIAHLSA
jgi:hypothetical protein